MSKIRVLYCSNDASLPARLNDLGTYARSVREEAGCIEFDYFRDVEFPENFAQLELWATPADFDGHWKRNAPNRILSDPALLTAPLHGGLPAWPRRHGINSAEFYRFAQFQIVDGAFLPVDHAQRIASVRWPTKSDHRIILQNATDPAHDDEYRAYAAETRRDHTGCGEFAYYRSLEFPENNLHLELWLGPPAVYDEHYFLRTLQRLYGIGLAQPTWAHVERRYGINGSEHYEFVPFALAGEVWQAEDPVARSATMSWPAP